jgi:hypothetical protein
MRVLLENAISPWGQFCCRGEIRHKFLNVWLVTVLASEWAIKIGMFILLIKYIYTGWSGVMNWGSRIYRCFLFMVVSSNPTWNKDKFVLLPWISNRGILHPKKLSSDKSYKTSKILLTWSVIEMTTQVADQRDFWARLHIGMQDNDTLPQK